jgi:hypothetical protein
MYSCNSFIKNNYMRNCFLIIVLFISLATTAQPNNSYTGKAKTFVDNFWKLADEIKKVGTEASNGKTPATKILIDRAKVQLKYVKTKDPAYDVTSMEQFLKPYEDDIAAVFQERNDAFDAKVRHNNPDADGCASIFKASKDVAMPGTGNAEADIISHIKQIDAYNEKVKKVLAGSMAGAEVCEDFLKTMSVPAKNRIDGYIKEMQKEFVVNVKVAYRELIGEEAYWNAAHKVYPNMQEAAEVYKKAKDAIASVGSMEDVAAKAFKKRQERLKNTFMPKAVIVNAALEAEFKEAFLNEGWNETIIRINITSREWTIIRHEVSGAIICRAQSAAIVAKQKSGNCILYDFTIKQQYTGSGYSNVSSRYTHDVYETEFFCDNAK